MTLAPAGRPRRKRRPMVLPTKAELLDLLEALEIVLSSLMRRRDDDGLPAEARAEIMTEIYEPVLRMLIRSRRRGASLPLPAAWR
jgi:hypothetical protein